MTQTGRNDQSAQNEDDRNGIVYHQEPCSSGIYKLDPLSYLYVHPHLELPGPPRKCVEVADASTDAKPWEVVDAGREA